MEKSDCARGDTEATQGERGPRRRMGGGEEGSDTKQDKNEGTIEQSHDWRPSVRETA